MTNSHAQQGTRAGKRERLVASAAELTHHNGVQPTTLAEIAEAADVPLGNVYYYFKTRDELTAAVIESRAGNVRDLLDSLQSRRSPGARLKALTRSWAEVDQLVADHGCPLGSLCHELNKQDDDLQRSAASVFSTLIDWAEAQFGELGHRDARDLAVHLFARVQGAALLANTLRDPKIMSREVRRLERWIDTKA